MPSISLCMIVKNEEAVLDRCLSSIYDLMDEIIILDTGSTDTTKEIALRYTNQVYDFKWTNDFSAARNAAFSHATCDYIYSADADEVLDATNHERLRLLKENLLPEIEIVQMLYTEHGYQTVLNSTQEYRPKLFKRLRTFTWIDPIHETVRTEPLVFDSDIEILHCPNENHSARDFAIFEEAYRRDGLLSKRILSMYCKELYKHGGIKPLTQGCHILHELIHNNRLPEDLYQEAYCIIARHARLVGNSITFLKYATKLIATNPCSEICFELGLFYEAEGDSEEAIIWYTNAAYETEPVLDINVLPKAKAKLEA